MKTKGRPTPQRQRSKNARATARVVVENVNTPGKSCALDAATYNVMRRALLKVLPRRSPGLNYAEMSRAVRPHLSEKVFPGGARAGWWLKTVQLDLEAKGAIAREKTSPLRWHRS
ncbi:MAG: hypothetical protein M3547_02615 [Acidobacteriota bacterium]|nr:hypothetical protein [Acidobacteriota bacterium]